MAFLLIQVVYTTAFTTMNDSVYKPKSQRRKHAWLNPMKMWYQAKAKQVNEMITKWMIT